MYRRYSYFRDPVFLSAVILYILNRALFKPWAHGHTHFFQFYFNDLICIPFWLPPWLYIYRRIGIRKHDYFPTRFEVLTHWIVWSLFFEWIGPAIKGPFAWAVADPWDITAYGAGALITGFFWGAWSQPNRKKPSRIEQG